jgi:hypothetical protein
VGLNHEQLDKKKAEVVKNASTDHLGLEEIVHLTNRIGMEYVEAKKNAELLELLKPTVRARIMQRYDDGTMSESKLKRITESDPEYIENLRQLIEAKSKAEQLKIRYDSYKNLFEAKRSLLSYQKAEMNLI